MVITPDGDYGARADDFNRRMQAFRERVDFSACTPRASAPFWLRAISTRARDDWGVLALLGPVGIGVRNHMAEQRTRFIPDPAALTLVSLAGVAQQEGLALAISAPPVARHLPLILVGASAVAQAMRRGAGIANAERAGILVVSSDLDIRSRYCDLLVGPQQVEEAQPGSRLRPLGDRVPLTPGRDLLASPGVCFFLPRGPLPKSIEYKPSLILLDLRYARTTQLRITELLAWANRIKGKSGIVALTSTGDTDTESQLLSAEFKPFALNHHAIQTCRDCIPFAGATRDSEMLQLSLQSASQFLERRHVIIPVEVTEEIDLLFANIGDVLDQNRGTDNLDLNRARWMLATLSQLPVPLSWYEQTAHAAGRQTIRRLIDRIGVMSRGEGLGAILQTLRVQFDLLYRYMERENPRATTFAKELLRLSTHPDKIVVIVRDRITQRAVRTWIDLERFRDCEWVNRIEVASCAEYAPHSCERYSRALICGVLPRRHRWIIGSALANEVNWLLYPKEVGIAEAQLRGFYDLSLLERQGMGRTQTVAEILRKSPVPQGVGGESTPSVLQLQLPRIPKAHTKSRTIARRGGLTDLARILAEKEEEEAEKVRMANIMVEHSWRATDDDPESPDGLEGTLTFDGPDFDAYKVAVRSSIHGVGHIWLRRDAVVECVSPSSPSDLRVIEPVELEPADVLLRVEEGGRSNLFDRIVELAENQPELNYLARFRRQWHDAMDRLALMFRTPLGIDYPAMLRALREHGAPVQTDLTPRNWVQGYVIGPEDVRSIIAVGKTTQLEAVVRSATEFDRAFRRIRGLHQGIGRRLTSSIRRHFQDFASGSAPVEDRATLDSRLGIPLDEMLETVEFLEVVSLSEVVTRVSNSKLRGFFT